MIATPVRIYLTNGTVSHELTAGQRACCGRWLAGYRRDMGCIFPGEDGRPLDAKTFWRYWTDVEAAAGLSHVPPHCLRHTAISRMLRAGIGIAEVAAIVGDTPQTLLKVYAHAQVEAARAGLARMDERARGA